MLLSMGDALIDYATQAIAQYIAIGIAKAFAGMGGGGGGGYQIPSGAVPLTSGMKFFADGGRPPTNQPSIVGERGPELFVPDTAGTVISNEQLRSSMETYGQRNDAGSYNEPMNINVETTTINGMEFITPDQFRKGMDQAASKGAKQGEQRAMNRLRQSRSTRQKVGV